MSKQNIKLKRSGGAKIRRFSEDEWRFDESRVPPDELVACCLWEYAREPDSIRQAVETAKTAFANQGIPRPESAEREAFRRAADKAFGLLLETGFSGDNIIFWTGLGFPKPWQLVDKTLRQKWAYVRPEIPMPVKFPPYQVVGDNFIAGMLYWETRKIHEARMKLYRRLSQIDRGTANLVEATELRKQLAAPSQPPIVRGLGGMDSFIAQINWRDFSNKEIKEYFCKWVDDKHRPANFPSPKKRGRGGTDTDWRARLQRLGLLRLRHNHTVEETLAIIAAGLPTAQRKKSKFVDPGECNREANESKNDFHELFSFLDPAEMPMSWPLK